MWKWYAANHNLPHKIVMVNIVAKVVEFYVALELLLKLWKFGTIIQAKLKNNLKLWKAQLRPRWPENPDSFQTLEVSSLSDLLKYERLSSSIG